MIVFGTILFFVLYSTWIFLRLVVSAIAFLIESVFLFAYNITLESTFLAALPIICIKLLVSRKNPSLSASSIPIKPISGISSPSLSKLIPTKTSNLPNLNSLIISLLSKVLISECKYLVLIFFSAKKSVSSSDNFFVRVVTITL